MNDLWNITPGPLLLFGSGETLPSSGKAYEFIAQHLCEKPKISIIETPAGFELNSDKVAESIGRFLSRRLQNYQPDISIIPARKKGTEFSPDNPHILEPLIASNWIFMGPGSPTYAVNQLKDSLSYDYIKSAHLMGAAITLASAAVLAMSAFTLPVYEIYKVGDDLHWQKGLDYLSIFGQKIVFVPHWNNTDGGKELDTSRCFMGKSRFEELMRLLPEDALIIGIDEQTGLLIEFSQPYACRIFGRGRISILHQNKEMHFESGQSFLLNKLGDVFPPDLDREVNKTFKKLRVNSLRVIEPTPSEEILALVNLREEARRNLDWQKSDQIRDLLTDKGWKIADTPEGPHLESLS